MSKVFRIGNSRDMTIRDSEGRVIAPAWGSRVILEGHDITNITLHVIESTDGMLQALCYRMKNGRHVIEDDKLVRETLVGRGHIFFEGCCSR